MRGKPELIKLTDKQGNLKSPYWYIKYYGAGSDGRKRSQRVSTGYVIGKEDHEATLTLAQFILERDRPTRKPDELMLAQALKDYYEEHAKFLPSADQAKYSDAKLNSFFNGYFVSQLTPSKIGEYIRHWQNQKRSNGTIRRDLQHLNAALNHEIREQRLLYAPKFKMPPPPAPKDRTLSSEEITRLLEHCKTPHVKSFVEIMRYTGQRPGAVENLKWFQVDFENRIIHFDRTGKQQTNKRARPVAMSDELYDLLDALFKAKKTEYVLEYEDIITGEIRHAGSVKKAFKRACKNAEITGATRYTLRHTVLDKVNDAADERTAADIGGHTDSRTTRKNYIKSKIDKQRVVLNGLWK